MLWALAEVASLVLIWSETTIWLNLMGLVKPNLSLFGQMLIYVDDNANHAYFGILFVCFIPLAYMCLLTMYTVFKLKVLGMDLSGDQNTDPYSLLVNVSGTPPPPLFFFFTLSPNAAIFSHTNAYTHARTLAHTYTHSLFFCRPPS